ncbi:MAG TPA: phosphoribosylglycinamide formyltransferase [Thermodesulfobacteriota bacterium]|nr:phosphoribosylglycinamide formyltransferase [Thermodesulfobacteriota bacterium]
MVRIGALVSGSGSNLQAIIDNIEAGRVDAKIEIVISNVPGVLALERAAKHGIKTAVLPHQGLKREEYDGKLVDLLRENGVELVVLAGFMRIITPVLLRAFPMKVMNIHPALLPAFPGTHVWQAEVDYGVKFAGCTVHFVDEGTDTGPIIIQAVVPVYDDDTAETLNARILRQEHKIFSQAIQLYAEGRLEIRGRRVLAKGHPRSPEDFLINPPAVMFEGEKG